MNHLPRFATGRAIGALVLREMSSTYGRHWGGYAWAVIEPAAMILVLALIFSVGFRTPALGTNFAIFMASGFLPFLLYTDVANKTAQSISYSRQLLSYPRVTFMDAILARLILTVLTRALVSMLILAFILGVYDTRTILDVPPILLSFGLAVLLGLGVGLQNAVLMTRFPIWRSLWGVLTRPLIFVSNVIFLIERFPEPFSSWLEWNPLVHIMALSRTGFYYSYRPDYISVGYVVGIALVLAVLGILFLRRYYRDFLEL
ncbi:ABC transporter permease [Marivivens marinus]|uniref:ABC transporter permease n=1 Tax=Marivivens marinus TaxID=3110173 RepID=UPI003B846A48